MDKFLETYNLLRLNQEEIENLNQAIISKESESVIKNLLINKSPGPESFTGEFYITFKEELIPIFSNPSKILKRRELIQIHFMSPALFSCQNQTRMPQEKKITGQYP